MSLTISEARCHLLILFLGLLILKFEKSKLELQRLAKPVPDE